MCFANKDPLKDGVNEHGLIGITKALANYKSVEELIEDLPNLHISTRDCNGEEIISPEFHFKA